MSGLRLAADCVAYSCIAGCQAAGMLAGILWAETGTLWNSALLVALGFLAVSVYLFRRTSTKALK